MADSHATTTPPQVVASRDAFMAAVARHDAAGAAELYSADALLLAPQMDWITGRSAIAAFWQAGLDSGIAGIRFDALTVAAFEGVAYELGRYTLAVEAEDAHPLSDGGDYMLVHRRDGDGQWRRAVEVMTSTRSGGGR